MGKPFFHPLLAGVAASLTTAATATAAPAISSFSPASGTIGTFVTINGSGFTGATAVKFSGVAAASYTIVSDIKITATVPNAVSTGQISVTVGASTGISTASFTVTPGMGLSLASGPPTSKATVSGAGFHPSNAIDLYFDNVNVALFVGSPTGTVSTVYQIPASAQPGQHWITLVERGSNWAAQKAFTVQTSWADQAFGPLGRGFNPYENTLDSSNVATLTSAWSVNAGGFGNRSPFVVGAGGIFVGDAFGTIRAYSTTGALLWTASPGGDMQHVNPAAGPTRVFFGDSNGNVNGFTQTCRTDGGVCTPNWTTNIGAPVTAGLTLNNGILYVPSGDGYIHVLNPNTGVQSTPIYGIDTAHGAVTTPVTFDTDGSFYYGVGAALEYNLRGGSVLGYSPYGGTLSPIAATNGSAYFTTSDGLLHRFGSGNWDVAISGAGCAAAPVVALGYVYAGGCTGLAAYVPKTGAVYWSVATAQIQGISEANNVLYVCEGPYGANLQAYAYYGSNLWTGGYCNSAPEITNGKVYSAFAYLSSYDLPTAVGNLRLAPAISSLHPDYRLKPQFSGSPVLSRTPVSPETAAAAPTE